MNNYIETELDDNEIKDLIAQGYVVEELPQAQEGESVVSSVTPYTKASEITGDETTPPAIYEGKDVTVTAKAPEWSKYQKEFQNADPWERFLMNEQSKYIRKHKNLNRIPGISFDNFPEAEQERIRQEYDQKMNDYITRRLGKSRGFNPRRRGEWLDDLTDREKQIVAGSRYGSKLQPSIWARFLSGVQGARNVANPMNFVYNTLDTNPLEYDVPTYTKAENERAKVNPLEFAEIFAPTEVLGAGNANYLMHSNPRLARPGYLSGEYMADVSPLTGLAVNPLTAFDLYALPETLVTAGNAGLKYVGRPFANEMANVYNDVRRVLNYDNETNTLNRIFNNYDSGTAPINTTRGIADDVTALEDAVPVPTKTNQIGYAPETAPVIPEGMVTGEQIAPQLQTQKAKPVQTWSPAPVTENTATLRSMQEDSPLFKIVDKRTGNMNINNIKAYLNKADTPKSDKVMLQEIIDEKFPNQKNINWDDLKKAVNEEVGQFKRTSPNPDTYADYGVNRLNLNPKMLWLHRI